MMKSFLLVLLEYLKKQIGLIIVFSLIASLFSLVFSLYSLPLAAVQYAALLSLVVLFLYLLLGFWKFSYRHQVLRDALHQISLSSAALPPAADLIAKDYQTLVEHLLQENAGITSGADQTRSEMVDYYTLWVHQIKTPISAMKLLLQSADSLRTAELQQELFKIEQYVNMVLQYLRLDSLSADMILQNYDLSDLVRQAVRKYALVFIHKKLFLHFDEMAVTVLTDEKWLVFVLEQVLSNALKYTRTGGIHIYMDPAAEKTLIIEDTGIGIQAEDLPRVFEKGFTGYNGHMDKKSTGIGLYLCRQILDKLSHTISIASEVAYGTKVSVDLATLSTRLTIM